MPGNGLGLPCRAMMASVFGAGRRPRSSMPDDVVVGIVGEIDWIMVAGAMIAVARRGCSRAGPIERRAASIVTRGDSIETR